MSMATGAMASRRGKGKMRPPKRFGPDSSSSTAIDSTFQKLSNAIREIQKHNASKLSFEEHYRYAYNMVLYKHGERLHEGVKSLVENHLKELVEDDVVGTFPRSGVMVSAGASVNERTAGTSKLTTTGSSSSEAGAAGPSSANGPEMAMEGERFLRALRSTWDDHSSSMSKLRSILKYMDKVYSPAANKPDVATLGSRLFESTVIHSPHHPIQETLLSVLLTQIHLERLGETINRSVVKSVVDVLATLKMPPERGRGSSEQSVYARDFESVFMGSSEKFYREEAESGVQAGDASAYLKLVERRLEEEQARCTNYLLASSSPGLLSILDEHLLSNHLTTILSMPGTGLDAMLEDDKMEDLGRVYKLFSRPGVGKGMVVLNQQLGMCVKERGKAINVAEAGTSVVGAPNANANSNASLTAGTKSSKSTDIAMNGNGDSKGKGKAREGGQSTPAAGSGSAAQAITTALKWVQDVLDLKDKFDQILKDGFADDKGIQTAINAAFQDFVNSNQKAQEYISLFIDENLKKGLKGKTADEVEAVLEKTIVLFRFIIDKDVFERYYKAHLAKRLLNGRSVSEEAERAMVSKIKIESGAQFTQKLEGMFTDMRLSGDMMRGFERHLGKGEPLGFDFNITVLTSTYWPGEANSTSCTFPPILTKAMTTFEQFYNTRHSGRRLTWHPNHGTADVRVAFNARKHELNVSTLGLVILLLFENLDEGEELTVQDLKASTNMSDADLTRSLQSLACGKFRVLTKNPKGREVGPNDKFSFNSGFTCPLAKIKIQTVVGKVENNEERKETHERVEEERKHQIEACIVRTMKDRKTLGHNELVSEVVRQLMSRFTPTPQTIKKRIEGLIDREYLERNGLGSYNYLA